MTTADVFIPNRLISKKVFLILVGGHSIAFLLFWAFATQPVIPKPWDIPRALRDLLVNGFVQDLLTSIALYLESLVLASVLSLGLAYASTIPFFQPLSGAWAKLRFLGLAGLPYYFTLYIAGVHSLKLALETFSISVFMLTSMLDVVNSIPKEKYDLARTLQMSEWGVLWEVVILGRADVAFDVIRQNAAIGWMMLPMIEGLFKSEGGIGAIVDIQVHHFQLETIAAIQIVILTMGLFQDYGIGWIKRTSCPYASLLLERR